MFIARCFLTLTVLLSAPVMAATELYVLLQAVKIDTHETCFAHYSLGAYRDYKLAASDFNRPYAEWLAVEDYLRVKGIKRKIVMPLVAPEIKDCSHAYFRVDDKFDFFLEDYDFSVEAPEGYIITMALVYAHTAQLFSLR